MKWLFIFSSFLLFNDVFSQNDALNKNINKHSEFANKLIFHLNINLKNSRKFQNQLNAWVNDDTKTLKDVPYYKASPFLLNEEYKSLIKNKIAENSSLPYNYFSSLKKLYKETLEFNELCEQLENVPKKGNKESFYSASKEYFNQIDLMSLAWVDLAYNFSLAAGASFKKPKRPVELENIRGIIRESKEVIRFIRENRPFDVRQSIQRLNDEIIKLNKYDNFKPMLRIAEIDIEYEKFLELKNIIINKAHEIAGWGEQYLQTDYSSEVVKQILAGAITAFNVSEDNSGCAATYNNLVSYSKIEYWKFTEEPSFFDIQEIDVKELERIEDFEIKQELLVEKSITIEDSDTLVERFNINDNTTLSGALPLNAIILMDVSASMKRTGKLPILKESIEYLSKILRADDKISLISYSGKATILLSSASAKDYLSIKNTIDTLSSFGGTDMQNGLKFGYDLAKETLIKNGNNRLLIFSDGIFGINAEITELIKENAKDDIQLSILHFAKAKEKPFNSLNMLSTIGKGKYHFITSSEEAINALLYEVKKENL